MDQLSCPCLVWGIHKRGPSDPLGYEKYSVFLFYVCPVLNPPFWVGWEGGTFGGCIHLHKLGRHYTFEVAPTSERGMLGLNLTILNWEFLGFWLILPFLDYSGLFDFPIIACLCSGSCFYQLPLTDCRFLSFNYWHLPCVIDLSFAFPQIGVFGFLRSAYS